MSDLVFNKELPLSRIDLEKNKHSIAKKVFLILCAILLLLSVFTIGVYYFVFVPSTSIAQIVFNGNTRLSEVFLKSHANISQPVKWSKINTEQVALSLAKVSNVETVSVKKVFPDKVLIDITERKPVVMTFAEVNQNTIPVFIDINGVLFTNNELEINNLPIISGLNFEGFYDGMKLNSQLLSLLKNISTIKNNNSKLLNQISEIKILPKKYGGYELLLFPIAQKIKIKVNDVLDEDILKQAILTLDVVKGIDIDITQIDLRGTTAILEKENNNE